MAVINGVVRAPRLAWATLRSGLVLRYGAVAVVKVTLDFAAFNAIILAASEPHWVHLLIANSAGFVAATWVAYRLNSSFAFRVERRPGDFGRFIAVSLVGGAIYNVTLLVLAVILDANGTTELNLAKTAALGASAGWNFVGYTLFVFHREAEEEQTTSPERSPRAA